MPGGVQTEIKTYQMFINGEWVASRTKRTFDDVNPADTRDIVGRFQASSKEDAKAAGFRKAYNCRPIIRRK